MDGDRHCGCPPARASRARATACSAALRRYLDQGEQVQRRHRLHPDSEGPIHGPGIHPGGADPQRHRLQEFQIIGGLEWIDTERFDVEATFAEADGPQVNLMLRALLTERFKLTVHDEKRERPIFALTLARADKRLGPELQKSATDCATAKGPDACGSTVAPGFIRLRGRTMAQFAESLSTLTITGSSLNRLILDRTGLEGAYHVTLKFTPDNIPPVSIPGLPPVDPNGPSIFTALQEQLGLKLEASNAMMPVLVVDSASRPTPN
jgi:uncharacterized protein (TIGR03435 family)